MGLHELESLHRLRELSIDAVPSPPAAGRSLSLPLLYSHGHCSLPCFKSLDIQWSAPSACQPVPHLHSYNTLSDWRLVARRGAVGRVHT